MILVNRGASLTLSPTPMADVKTKRRTPDVRMAERIAGTARAIMPFDLSDVPRPSVLMTASLPRAAAASAPSSSGSDPIASCRRAFCTDSFEGVRTNAVTSCPDWIAC